MLLLGMGRFTAVMVRADQDALEILAWMYVRTLVHTTLDTHVDIQGASDRMKYKPVIDQRRPS